MLLLTNSLFWVFIIQAVFAPTTFLHISGTRVCSQSFSLCNAHFHDRYEYVGEL